MNYELTKKLKVAGFPQPRIGITDNIPDCYEPTLSELIEACGDKFEDLVRIEYPKGNIFWRAYPTDDWFDGSGIPCVKDCCGYQTGSTPEEAVANLYLEIHKK